MILQLTHNIHRKLFDVGARWGIMAVAAQVVDDAQPIHTMGMVHINFVQLQSKRCSTVNLDVVFRGLCLPKRTRDDQGQYPGSSDRRRFSIDYATKTAF
jgi:hypothetical protein